MNTFTHWIEMPENRPAVLAIQRVAACVCSKRRSREINPLFLHGPAGTGKTHLVSALVTEATGQRPDLLATVFAAGRSGRCPVASVTRADTRCVLPVPAGPCKNNGLISRLRRFEQTHAATRWMARTAGRFSGISIQWVNVFMLPPNSAKGRESTLTF